MDASVFPFIIKRNRCIFSYINEQIVNKKQKAPVLQHFFIKKVAFCGYRLLNKKRRPQMKPVLLIHYPKCSTCQKAKKWLETNHIPFTERHIVTDAPTAAELTAWLPLSGKPSRAFFNTSGLVYKNLGLKDKLPTLSEAAQIQLLSQNGMLVKRPLVIAENRVLIGFKPNEWEQLK